MEVRIIKETILEWSKTIVISFVIALIITRFVTPTLIFGTSMSPTFNNLDYLIVNKSAYWMHNPKAQDFIVFNSSLNNNRILIKRVIAVEGDALIIKDGKVTVNEKQLNEPYIQGQPTLGSINSIVPTGKVFVMGDNRLDSYDSRFQEVGYVNKTDIIGKVGFSIFPLSLVRKESNCLCIISSD